jgi:hypothetical protein
MVSAFGALGMIPSLHMGSYPLYWPFWFHPDSFHHIQ